MLSAKAFLLTAALLPMLLQGGSCDDVVVDTDGVDVGEVAFMEEQCEHCHDSSGIATILDENTIQIDEFTYDGSDVDVYIYLGVEGVSLKDYGIQLTEELKEPYNNDTLVLDLPEGVSLADFDTISVFCYRYNEVFAVGSFE